MSETMVHDDLGKLRQLTYELNEIERNLKIRDERYRFILESMQEGVIEIDTCGIIVYANRGIERILGVGSDALIGCYFPEFLEDPKHLEVDFTDRLLCRFPNMECTLISSKGKRVHVLCSTSPIVVDDRVMGLAVVATDITDRLILEERYKIIFEEATEGIAIVDAKNHAIIDCNPVIARKLGYTHEEMVAMRIEDIEVVDSEDEIRARIEGIAEHQPIRFDSRHRRKSGEEINVVVSARMLTYNGNSFLLAFCCYQE